MLFSQEFYRRVPQHKRKMFRVIAVFLILGAVAKAQTCVTQDDVNAVNLAVQSISSNAKFQVILTMTGITEQQRTFMILNATCNEESVRTQANILDTKIRACPALINSTQVSQLQINGLQFAMIFQVFPSMDKYCECFPAFLQAMGIKVNRVSTLVLNIPNGKYASVINTATICEKTAFDTPAAIELVKNNLERCPTLIGVMEHSSLNPTSIRKMSAFIQKGYCGLTNVDDNCMVTQSSSSEFKYCMDDSRIGNDVTADDVRNTPGCRRSVCIEDKMNTPCGTNTSIVFRWAASIYGHDVNVVDDCNAATSIITSVFLLIVAVMMSLMM